MPYRVGSIVAIVILALMTRGGPESFAASASAKTVNLRTSDLPTGFKQVTGKVVSNAQMARDTHVPKAQFDQHGRIIGYQTEFDRNGTKGVVLVAANTYAYKSSSGAQWDYAESVQHDLAQGFKRASAPRVGDASTGLVFVRKSGKQTITFYLIDFRRGTYDATVGVAGLTGQVRMSDALHFVLVVDQRIQKG
jgi:hypothetical protein